MKNALIFLLLCAQSLLAMTNPEDDQKESKQIIVLPGHDLPNAQVNLLIDALKPGEVVLSITREAGLKVNNEFNDFYVVCFQRGRYQDAFYFVPERMHKDAEKALSIYAKTRPNFYAHLIPVKDDAKFLSLALKSSAGAAGKGGAWYEDVTWDNNLANYDGYTLLDKSRIEFAINAPKQDSNEQHKAWSCGPNSVYRVKRLIGEPCGNYDDFVGSCPRTINRGQISDGGNVAQDVGGGLLGVGLALAPITGGLSLIPGAVMFVAGSCASLTSEVIPCDVGPDPKPLADYCSGTMVEYKAVYAGYSKKSHDSKYNPQGDYEKVMVHDIRNAKTPTMVLIISHTFRMHYVTVVGYKASVYGDFLQEAVILDTDGALGKISDEKLAYWLDRDGIANWILDDKFSTIRFVRK